MPRGRPRKERPDIPEELVRQFVNEHPNGATSGEIARFLGIPVMPFAQECFRIEQRLKGQFGHLVGVPQ